MQRTGPGGWCERGVDEDALHPVKQRLDTLLVATGLAADLTSAQAVIGAGEVLVNEERIDKAGFMCPADARLRIKKPTCPYVSRGGIKLQGGLDAFAVNPSGWKCADIGASTGGFTDCLLQHGASKVYAVDVAYGQLNWKLRQDPRVVVIERFNARGISRAEISEPIDLAVLDASFISLTRLIPPLLPLFGNRIRIIALIKPQFELAREKVPPGGVVRDPALHGEVMDKIRRFGEDAGLISQGPVPSPIVGPKGNREFLIYLTSKS